MKLKKLLSLLLALVMAFSMMATLGISASAAPRTDATPVCVGETYDRVEFVSSVTTFSAEEQDGNLWYFYTTDETKLKVVNYYIEEDAVEGDKLHVFLKGIAVGNGLEILCKQYDAESTSWVDGVSAINGIYSVVPAPVYLDLDSTTTDILDEKELDQNYNLTVTEGDSIDVTKVKLSWNISDINAVRMDDKVWDTTELKWVDQAGTPTVTDNGTATFKLENYSSVKMDVTARFEATDDEHVTVAFDEATGTDGKITLDTANGSETYSKTNVPKGEITVTVTPSADYFKDKSATTTAAQYGTYTVTVSKYTETDCLAKGTKITMADGTLKNIEDITEGDEVLTYNHEEGRYEPQKVYLAWASEAPKSAFTLHFTGGIDISVIGDHCFFEKESLSYVAVLESNAESFVGKHFYNASAGRYEELLRVTYGQTPVDYYEIYTEYNANCIAEGLLNVAYDTSELLNIYKFNEDLTVDHAQLASDIARYGIFEYVENERYSKELYDALGWKYTYVMIGKGFGTMEEYKARIDAFLADR